MASVISTGQQLNKIILNKLWTKCCSVLAIFKIKEKSERNILFRKERLQKISFLLDLYGLLSSVSGKNTVT